MALITETPDGLPTTNALDGVDVDDDLEPAAYLSFGTTPCALEGPPDIDDVRIYLVRARCIGKSEKERTDGEMRHGRQLQIQACWRPGQTEPTADDNPTLFDDDTAAE